MEETLEIYENRPIGGYHPSFDCCPGIDRQLSDFRRLRPRLTTKWRVFGVFLSLSRLRRPKIGQFFFVVPGGGLLSNIRILQLSSSKVTSHRLRLVSSGRPPIVNSLVCVVCCFGGTNLGTRVVRLCSHGPHVITSVCVLALRGGLTERNQFGAIFY